MGNQGVNSSWHLDEIAGEKCFTSERWTLNRTKQYLIRKNCCNTRTCKRQLTPSAELWKYCGKPGCKQHFTPLLKFSQPFWPTASGAISAQKYALVASHPTTYLLYRIQILAGLFRLWRRCFVMLSLSKHLPKPNTGGKILRFAQDDKKGRWMTKRALSTLLWV